MSYYTKQGVIFVLIILTMYLAGAFANASFNLAEWNPFIRGAVVVVWACIVGIHAIIVRCSDYSKTPPPERYH